MVIKKKTVPTAQEKLVNVAALCGTLSGMCDHITKLQVELQDIAGRCALAVAYGQDADKFTPKDRADLDEIREMCKSGFEDLLQRYSAVEAMLKRQRPDKAR